MVLHLELHHVLHAGVMGDTEAVGAVPTRVKVRDPVVARSLNGVRPLIRVHVAVGEEVRAIVGGARGCDGRGQEYSQSQIVPHASRGLLPTAGASVHNPRFTLCEAITITSN